MIAAVDTTADEEVPAELATFHVEQLRKNALLGTLPGWLSPSNVIDLWADPSAGGAREAGALVRHWVGGAPLARAYREAVRRLVTDAVAAGKLGVTIRPAGEAIEHAPPGGWALSYGFSGDDADRRRAATASRKKPVPAVLGINRRQLAVWLQGVQPRLQPAVDALLWCWIGIAESAVTVDAGPSATLAQLGRKGGRAPRDGRKKAAAIDLAAHARRASSGREFWQAGSALAEARWLLRQRSSAVQAAEREKVTADYLAKRLRDIESDESSKKTGLPVLRMVRGNLSK